jgi:hypothetical protein
MINTDNQSSFIPSLTRSFSNLHVQQSVLLSKQTKYATDFSVALLRVQKANDEREAAMYKNPMIPQIFANSPPKQSDLLSKQIKYGTDLSEILLREQKSNDDREAAINNPGVSQHRIDTSHSESEDTSSDQQESGKPQLKKKRGRKPNGQKDPALAAKKARLKRLYSERNNTPVEKLVFIGNRIVEKYSPEYYDLRKKNNDHVKNTRDNLKNNVQEKEQDFNLLRDNLSVLKAFIEQNMHLLRLTREVEQILNC